MRLRTRFTELLGIEHPIVQGGMIERCRAMTDKPFGVNLTNRLAAAGA